MTGIGRGCASNRPNADAVDPHDFLWMPLEGPEVNASWIGSRNS